MQFLRTGFRCVPVDRIVDFQLSRWEYLPLCAINCWIWSDMKKKLMEISCLLSSCLNLYFFPFIYIFVCFSFVYLSLSLSCSLPDNVDTIVIIKEVYIQELPDAGNHLEESHFLASLPLEIDQIWKESRRMYFCQCWFYVITLWHNSRGKHMSALPGL